MKLKTLSLKKHKNTKKEQKLRQKNYRLTKKHVVGRRCYKQQCSLSHTHTRSLSHTHSFSFAHSFSTTHTISLSLSLSPSLSLPLSLPISLSHTHTLSLSHTHSFSFAHSFSHTQTHSLSLSLSLSLFHARFAISFLSSPDETNVFQETKAALLR